MSILKSLTLTAAQPFRAHSPQQQRRDKLVSHLREQLAIVQAEPAGSRHVVLKRRRQTTADGNSVQVDSEKRLQRWWIETIDDVILVVCWAHQPIEFEKGKSAISVGSVAKLPDVLPQLIAAAANGEFDPWLGGSGKPKNS